MLFAITSRRALFILCFAHFDEFSTIHFANTFTFMAFCVPPQQAAATAVAAVVAAGNSDEHTRANE